MGGVKALVWSDAWQPDSPRAQCLRSWEIRPSPAAKGYKVEA
jgi:hypothetical protein